MRHHSNLKHLGTDCMGDVGFLCPKGYIIIIIIIIITIIIIIIKVWVLISNFFNV